MIYYPPWTFHHPCHSLSHHILPLFTFFTSWKWQLWCDLADTMQELWMYLIAWLLFLQFVFLIFICFCSYKSLIGFEFWWHAFIAWSFFYRQPKSMRKLFSLTGTAHRSGITVISILVFSFMYITLFLMLYQYH